MKSKTAEQESPPAASPQMSADTSPAPAVEPTVLPVEIIPIDTIRYQVDNHRPVMDGKKLQELIENIRVNGVKQPIKVCRRSVGRTLGGEPTPVVHVMVFGHRRAKASQLAGLTTIPAMIATDMTDQQIAEEQCIENLHREDVGPIGEAFAVKTLLDGGRPIEVVASMLNKPVAWCHYRMILLRLHKDIQDLVNRLRLPIGHAFEIAKVGDQEEQLELAYQAIGCHDRGRNAKSLAEAIADDYLEPLKDVRKTISWKLCKMGSAHWPRDCEYAGKRPCNGCPDNTNTTPALFENINLTSAKGNCTNPACFECKSKTWDRDPVKKARDKEREQQRAGKAKASGEHPEQRGKRGETYEQQQKRCKALKKKFPWEPEQKFAVAMWKYGTDVASALVEHVEMSTPDNIEGVLLVLILSDRSVWLDAKDREIMPPLKDAVDGVAFSGKAASMLLKKCLRIDHRDGPGIDYSGEVRYVPLPQHALDEIKRMEDMAKAWKVSLPAKPKAEDFVQTLTPATAGTGCCVAALHQFEGLPDSMKGKKGFVVVWATSHNPPKWNFEAKRIRDVMAPLPTMHERCCCVAFSQTWTFTDSGFIDGGQDGAYTPSRPSCASCCEKHLGAAYVLLTETRDGYAHRLRAIGHLFEAEDESQAWPQLHNAIREARRAYQAASAMPDWESLAAMLAACMESPG